jgi:hypothetical protein
MSGGETLMVLQLQRRDGDLAVEHANPRVG